MKEKITRLLTLVLMICMLVPNVRVDAKATPTPKPKDDADNSSTTGRTILLDPGHGSLGSTGGDGYNGMNEGDATFKVALSLGKELESRGYKVYCTRLLSDKTGKTHLDKHKELYEDKAFQKEVIKKVTSNGYIKSGSGYAMKKGGRALGTKQIYDNAARGKLGADLGCDMSFSFHFDCASGYKGSCVVEAENPSKYAKDTSLSEKICSTFVKNAKTRIKGWVKENNAKQNYTQHQFASVPLAYIEMAGTDKQIKDITENTDTYAKYLADGIDACYDEGLVKAGGTATTATEKPATNNTTTGGTSRFSEDHYIATERPLHEKEVKFADGSDLTSHEKTNLNIMKDDLIVPKESGIITFLRTLAVFLGVVITVYTIFLYMIYWFDRVNSLMDFSLLKVVTFGRMETSKGYDLDYGEDSKVKVCEHSDILRSCIIGIAIGMFLTTGRIYYVAKWLYGVVQWFLVEVFG